MSNRSRYLALIVALAVTSLSRTDAQAQAKPIGAQPLKVNASLPREIDQRRTRQGGVSAFRILFRVLAGDEAEAPFTTLLRMSGELAGWSAYTSSGAQCRINSSDLQGAAVYVGPFGNDQDIARLQSERSASSVAHPIRPTVVRADFVCDEAIDAGDTATIQARFFVLNGSRWQARDLTFRDLVIEPQ